MLFDRYCQDTEDKKIFSLNLVHDKVGNKETKLSRHYEELLEHLKVRFEEKNQKVGYYNFDWHKLTKEGTEPFDEFMDEYLLVKNH